MLPDQVSHYFGPIRVLYWNTNGVGISDMDAAAFQRGGPHKEISHWNSYLRCVLRGQLHWRPSVSVEGCARVHSGNCGVLCHVWAGDSPDGHVETVL